MQPFQQNNGPFDRNNQPSGLFNTPAGAQPINPLTGQPVQKPGLFGQQPQPLFNTQGGAASNQGTTGGSFQPSLFSSQNQTSTTPFQSNTFGSTQGSTQQNGTPQNQGISFSGFSTPVQPPTQVQLTPAAPTLMNNSTSGINPNATTISNFGNSTFQNTAPSAFPQSSMPTQNTPSSGITMSGGQSGITMSGGSSGITMSGNPSGITMGGNPSGITMGGNPSGISMTPSSGITMSTPPQGINMTTPSQGITFSNPTQTNTPTPQPVNLNSNTFTMGSSNPTTVIRQPGQFQTQPATTPLTVSENSVNMNSNTTFANDTSNRSSFISSMKDNTVNLYNLKLQEIIDMYVAALDKNIKEFKEVARVVFEQDTKLNRAKNNYLETKNKIEQEEARLNELEEGLECLSKHLDQLPTGTPTEMGRCCEEFESICDRFYKQLELLKDDQDEVMALVNENYMLIETIDSKMDMLERSYE